MKINFTLFNRKLLYSFFSSWSLTFSFSDAQQLFYLQEFLVSCIAFRSSGFRNKGQRVMLFWEKKKKKVFVWKDHSEPFLCSYIRNLFHILRLQNISQGLQLSHGSEVPGYFHMYRVPTQVTARFGFSNLLSFLCYLWDFHIFLSLSSPPLRAMRIFKCTYALLWSIARRNTP